jgi:3-oxo-5alpha-steroid 4-dehydrogenase
MARFLLSACGPHADERKVVAYCQNSVAHFDWLVDCGVPFKASFWSAPTAEPWNDDGLMFSGGEDTHPFDTIAVPAPRGHCPSAPSASRFGAAGGSVLMAALCRRAAAIGVRVVDSTRVTRMAVESDGSMAGVHARRFGEDVCVRARRGVVLAAGGFISDDALVADHAPHLLGTGKLGVDENDGRVMTAAMAVGAATQRLSAGEVAFSLPPALVKPGVLVNTAGRRFINEDAYLGRIGQHALLHEDGEVHLILDEQAFEEAAEFRGPVLPDVAAETVADLAAETGLPQIQLEATIATYNAYAERGHDVLGKKPRWLRPLRPPFAAIRADDVYRTFTLGGLKTDVDGRVWGLSGEVVPGLFAAGRITSGLPATGYVSGASLGDGSYFGRRAGAAAAMRGC